MQVNQVSPDRSYIDGKVWLQDAGTYNVYRLDIATGTFEKFEPYKIPRPNVYDVIPDSQNNGYFLVMGAEEVGRMDAKTGAIEIFKTPTRGSGPRRGMMDGEDKLWFGENRSDKVGMFDTRTRTFKEWAPTPGAWPYDATVDRNGEVWSGGEYNDRILRLDPRTGRFIEYLLPGHTNVRRVFVDNSTTPVTFWVGSNHAASIVKLETLDAGPRRPPADDDQRFRSPPLPDDGAGVARIGRDRPGRSGDRRGADWSGRRAAAYRRAPSFRAAGVGHRGSRPSAAAAGQHHLTPEKSIADMDHGGVAAAVVSITNPGLWFGDAAVTRRSGPGLQRLRREARSGSPDAFRAVRRDAAARRGRHPRRDRLRLRHAESGRRRRAHELWRRVARQSGVSSGHGRTHRRRAVVHVHPTAANCCKNLDYAPGVGAGSMEYGTDTTRAIIGVAFSGDLARYPNIRFIWSHAGGTVPFLAGRINGASGNAKDRLPNGFIAEIKKHFYDLAGAANKGAIASLRELVPATQILFGTDFPPGGTSFDVANTLRELGIFSAADLRAIDRDNAVALMPRLART